MTLFFQIYAIFLLILSLIGLIHYLVVRGRKARKNEVRLPLWIQLIGIVGTVVFGIILLWAIADGEDSLWLLIGFASFSLLGVPLILAPMRTIRYDKSGFVVRSFPFYLPRRFEYSEVTAIREDINVIYLGKKRVLLNNIDDNFAELFLEIRFAYEKLHKAPLPERKKKSIDPFNGNVDEPGGFVFVWILLFAQIIGMVAVGYFFGKPPAKESLTVSEVVFTRCEMEEESILFYTDGDEARYRIHYRESIPTSDEAFLALAEEKQRVQIHTEMDEEGEYSVYTVTKSDGEVLLTYEDAIHEGMLVWYLVIGLAILFTFIWTWCVVRSIQIGRNPQKYSRKTILRYFRPDFVRVNGRYVK